MDDLTVENMFAVTTHEERLLIECEWLTSAERKRLISHAMGLVTGQILLRPGADVRGLTVTVSAQDVDRLSSNLVVVATCPGYQAELS